MINEPDKSIRTLAVDIGGSGIKVMVLDAAGKPFSERARLPTPQPAKPPAVIKTVITLAEQQEFDRVSVGFPGVVQHGIIKTAVNLDPDWIGFNFATNLEQLLSKPVKIANDADIQGFGAISGKGVELVITLGTGFGSALFLDGKLVPNLELGHHPFRKGETYEQQLGRATLAAGGKRKWNNRLQKAIATLEYLFNYDALYIGGGETSNINFDLPANAKVVPNLAGLLGGIKLWSSYLSSK